MKENINNAPELPDELSPENVERPIEVVMGVPALPEVAPTDAEYLSRAEEFMKQAAKMNNAPVVYMVAAAFELRKDAQRMADAIRRFRNLALGPYTKLRATPEYCELVLAWENYSDKIQEPK